jgi:hypothetical protein
VVLEDNGAHPARVRETSHFDRIDRARPIVRRGVNMNINRAGEESRAVRISLRFASARWNTNDCDRNSGGSKSSESRREESRMHHAA